MDNKLRQLERLDRDLALIEHLRLGNIELSIETIDLNKSYPQISYLIKKGVGLFREGVLKSPSVRMNELGHIYLADQDRNQYLCYMACFGNSNSGSYLDLYWDNTFDKNKMPPFFRQLVQPLIDKLKERDGQ